MRPPRRAADNHWDLNSRIPHKKLCKFGRFSPKSDQAAPATFMPNMALIGRQKLAHIAQLALGNPKIEAPMALGGRRVLDMKTIKSPTEGVVKRAEKRGAVKQGRRLF